MNKKDTIIIKECLNIRIAQLKVLIRKQNHKIVCLKFDNKDKEMNSYDSNQINTWEYGIENAYDKIEEIEKVLNKLEEKR